MEKIPNNLIFETSPYLLQHAYNPVNWNVWRDETLKIAKNENKLILISIGYSACHWCHVMEKESFEDEEVAFFMNKFFVNIKVDREERPDIDQVYMDAVQIMNNRGGWPLNCVCLPDGRPVWGGTYFPKVQWIKIIQQLYSLWNGSPETLLDYATKLHTSLKSMELIESNSSSQSFTNQDFTTIFNQFKIRFDLSLGGFDKAPKFPTPENWRFLIHYSNFFKHEISAIPLTLKSMLNGGIYDQIGGGFARYSVDPYWFVPHFEKMLYDNAQLIGLYSEAFNFYKNIEYKIIVENSISFLINDLKNEKEVFYSALDADSEGIEGKYYCWSYTELKEILKDKFDIFQSYYDITEHGNWEENMNILVRRFSNLEIANSFQLSEVQLLKIISYCNIVLLEIRNKRIKPSLDDKQLLSWNALAIVGICKASVFLQNPEYLDIAKQTTDFILKNFQENGKFYRSFKNGKLQISGFLDDYAFFIDALIHLSFASQNEFYLLEAQRITEFTIKHFYNPERNIFYYTSDLDEKLIVRKTEIYDSVTPSSNSIMFHNLLTLGVLFDKIEWTSWVERSIYEIKPAILQYPTAHATWANLALKYFNYFPQIAFSKEIDNQDFIKLQNKFFAYGFVLNVNKFKSIPYCYEKLNSNKIYSCLGKECFLPVDDFQDLLI